MEIKTNRYNPGTVGEVTHLGGSRYSVQSFTDRSKCYTVDLDPKNFSCECPLHQKKIQPEWEAGNAEITECKHASAARQAAQEAAYEKAKDFSPEALRHLLQTRSYRPEVAEGMFQALRVMERYSDPLFRYIAGETDTKPAGVTA